ncbi:hypothetical protein LCGC14_1982830 [marine sediment metagenome]|uniref:Uncharacterized protein n=1 Tax=marine sediment metagenome TaxID=412755 RepID=A0A0F9HLL5_9ZZZZ
MTSNNGNGALGFNDFVAAAVELIRGQFFTSVDLEPISRSAARLLVETGVVGTEAQGQVLFHETITRDKPALRRILRDVDRRAGRVPKRKPLTAGQRAVIVSLRAGEVKRKNGKIAAFTPRAMRAIRAAKQRDAIREDARKKSKRERNQKLLTGFAVKARRKRGKR